MNASALAIFERHRARLFAIAYKMLGTVSDSEDVVQDTFVRWNTVATGDIDQPGPYLARIATRLCLDRMRALKRSREDYVGQWLPEPIIDQYGSTTMEIERFDHDVSYALMLALERLSPLERAAFILHDLFDFEFSEIAGSIGRTEPACRQLARRARTQLQNARPRFAQSGEKTRMLAEAFFRAARQGDRVQLLEMLASDVRLQSDGGGKKLALPNVLTSPDAVAAFFAGLAEKGILAAPRALYSAKINDCPGQVSIEKDGTLQTFAVEASHDKIRGIFFIRNPDKLRQIGSMISRSSARSSDPSAFPGKPVTPSTHNQPSRPDTPCRAITWVLSPPASRSVETLQGSQSSRLAIPQ